MDLSTREGRREQGQLIQKAVEKAGLSVEELANRIGCSRALIYQYLSGTTLAQPDKLQQIAAETGVELAYFYGAAPAEEVRRSRRAIGREDPQAQVVERIQQMEELARAQEGPPDWGGLTSTCERIISLAAQIGDENTEARALLRMGKARLHMGEFNRAADNLARAAALFEALQDQVHAVDARQALGNALLSTGRITEAREQFEQVARSERWEARWSGTVSLAAVYEQLGDYRKAMECCDEAAAIVEEAGDTSEAARGMLYVNANRVNIYLACGDFQSAEPLAANCLSEAEAFGISDQHLEARLNLGMCALHLGRWAEAYRTFSTAVQLARFLGDKGREAMARATLAMLLAAIGEYDTATQNAKDALAAALSQGDRRTELFAQMALTDAYLGAERYSEARYHGNQAFAVSSALRLALYEVECRVRLARLCLRTGEDAEAVEYVQRALRGAQELGARHLEAQAYGIEGELMLRSGHWAQADADARKALALSSELGMIPLQWEAKALIARVAAASQPPQLQEAVSAASGAVALMGKVRAELREAGIADSVLEDVARQEIYLLCARLLNDLGRAEEAAQMIEQAGWPPLSARFEGRG